MVPRVFFAHLFTEDTIGLVSLKTSCWCPSLPSDDLMVCAAVLAETSADSHTKDELRNPAARAPKARKRTTREVGASTNPSHWAKSCQEASSSAQIVLTSLPVSSSSEVGTAWTLCPVNNSANSENVVDLAAILRDVLSPGGSSESARATRLATLARSAGYVVRVKYPVFAARDQTKHLSIVVDSGAEDELQLRNLQFQRCLANGTRRANNGMYTVAKNCTCGNRHSFLHVWTTTREAARPAQQGRRSLCPATGESLGHKDMGICLCVMTGMTTAQDELPHNCPSGSNRP